MEREMEAGKDKVGEREIQIEEQPQRPDLGHLVWAFHFFIMKKSYPV